MVVQASAGRPMPRVSDRGAARWIRLAWQLRVPICGALLTGVMVVAALGAPYLAPHDPLQQEITARLRPPAWMEGGSPTHLLGTDALGRDLLSRIVYGARVSLTAGVLAVVVSGIIGVGLGLLGGYFGGRADAVVNGAVSIMMAFPFMLLALTAIAVAGPSFRNIVIVLGVTTWPIYTRVVRAETLVIREREFVLAARALGGGAGRIMLRHILPNLASTLLVLGSLEVARMIILESFLSFLGLGVPPPTPSWGGMLGEGRIHMLSKWWIATFPGLAIFLATLGITFVGDGLRDLLDPRLKDSLLGREAAGQG
ncbi:MAG: ABC transporter permease [Deltaproteobacteria bacterium]|nr:ABC transporter permease [Deltaproteobacteria bacterium]MBI3078247.1 ABC transporter permease [Deltaproteobacteria bacterium]